MRFRPLGPKQIDGLLVHYSLQNNVLALNSIITFLSYKGSEITNFNIHDSW